LPHPRMTYAKAGVDTRHIRETHKLLARRLESTFATRKGKVGWPIFPIGHYAGLVDLGQGRVLSLHTDSVGTKVLIAQMMKKYDTIGIDCVAMCANDLICTGAEPISFLDYMAMSRPDRSIVDEVAIGLAKGAKEAGMAIVGGETAIVPELLAENGGFDLVGFAAGFCKKKDLILGNSVRDGDILIGVASSGIHSNGLSLARKVLFKKYDVTETPPGLERSLGDELLEPTRIYVKPIREIIGEMEVHGLAHITGGGSFLKIERVLGQSKRGADLDNLPEPPVIFHLIERQGRISRSEMYRTFNMGIGLVIVCPELQAKQIIRTFRKHRQDAVRIGRVEKTPGIRIKGKLLRE
jgi:phosphoribosylformylglycinamidine cyclo-ligase